MQKNDGRSARGHGFTLQEREVIHVTGVDAVERFDENTVLLETVLGRLRIDGTQLHVQRLDLEAGQAVVRGKIEAAVYEKTRSGKNLLERIFT